MTGKLKLEALPVGRFLYTVNGSGPIREGRVLEQCADREGCWLKLWPGPDWAWSGDIWIETELPEARNPVIPEEPVPKTANTPNHQRKKKKFFK